MTACYLFDIDGTLADCSHRLHHIQSSPKDWRTFFSECKGDFPIPHIIGLALDLERAGAAIVYVSGRSDECRELTEAWLAQHRLPILRLAWPQKHLTAGWCESFEQIEINF